MYIALLGWLLFGLVYFMTCIPDLKAMAQTDWYQRDMRRERGMMTFSIILIMVFMVVAWPVAIYKDITHTEEEEEE